MILTVFIVALLLAAAVSAQDESVLAVGISGGMDTLDNAAASSASAEIILGQVFDTLVIQQPLGVYHPGLATSWTINADATEYIFELRRDVAFHDGSPFNAAAVKHSFDRIVDPDSKARTARSFIGPYAESEVLSEHSIAVRFSSPNAAFLDALSRPQLAPVSPSALEMLSGDWGVAGLVGTGPFIFETYAPDTEIILVKNPNYAWGNEDVFGRSGPPSIDRLIFKILTDPAERLAALESGEVDMINAVPALAAARLEESGGFIVARHDQAGHGHSLIFNQTKSPTDEFAVRKAIAQAIDIDIMQDIVYDASGGKACSALTRSMLGWTDVACRVNPYDPEAAGALLDQAGWLMNEETGIRERDDRPLTIEHWSPDRPLNVVTAYFIAEDMAALGVDFQINLADDPAYLAALRASDYHTLGSWDAQTDPDGVFRALFHSSKLGASNRSNYRNVEMDAMIDAAAGLLDPESRAAAYAEIQRKLAEEVVMVYFNDPAVLYARGQDLRNVTILNGGLLPNFYSASIDI
ncbi:MAG: ABC transporter substrate-binding protein [Chloroflexi bacterium]|nr:ABC transporter substrate-binding protein [Chloroflexota bacterium]